MNEPHNKKGLFPSIYRFITEYWKVWVVGLTSIVLIVGIASQSLLLTKNLKEFDKVQKQRAKLVGELSYWEQIVKEYGGYRDAYFRIASLQYQLGEMGEAEKSVEKVLGIDPNFENARVLGAKIKAKK